MTPEVLQEGLPELIRLVGEPLADPAWVPTALLARRASRDVKLALVGEGADELFGGYPTYVGPAMAGRYARLPQAVRARPPRHRRAMAAERPEGHPVLPAQAVRGGGGARARGPTPALDLEHLARALAAARHRGRAGGRAPMASRERRPRRPPADRSGDLARGGPPHQGRPGEHALGPRASRALPRPGRHGVRGLPPRDRAGAGRDDEGLPQALRPPLPARRKIVSGRKKRGLSVPLARWLRGPLHALGRGAASATADSAWRGSTPTRPSACSTAHRKRQGDHARALWTLIVLAEWLEWAPCAAGRARERPDDGDRAQPTLEEPAQAVGDLGGPHAWRGRRRSAPAREAARPVGPPRPRRGRTAPSRRWAHGGAPRRDRGSPCRERLPASTMRSGRSAPMRVSAGGAVLDLDDLVAHPFQRPLQGRPPSQRGPGRRRGRLRPRALRSPAAMCSSLFLAGIMRTACHGRRSPTCGPNSRESRVKPASNPAPGHVTAVKLRQTGDPARQASSPALRGWLTPAEDARGQDQRQHRRAPERRPEHREPDQVDVRGRQQRDEQPVARASF